jgi:hypothetical protein
LIIIYLFIYLSGGGCGVVFVFLARDRGERWLGAPAFPMAMAAMSLGWFKEG